MGKYLLEQDVNRVDSLVNSLEDKLSMDLNGIREKFYQFLLTTKDYSIEDSLAYFCSLFSNDLSKLINEGITPSMQFGLKNDYFDITGHAFRENATIDSNTFFQFDSISKVIVSTLIMLEKRSGNIALNESIHEINPDFVCNASLQSILNFTAMLQTEKRIDNLGFEETLQILRHCQENLDAKKEIYHYYQYNDIGYMMIRLAIKDFLSKLDNLLHRIDPDNLSYISSKAKYPVIGGKINEESISPDCKGRDIIFPGHAGLCGNIMGLLNLFYAITCTDNILNSDEKRTLLTQPYDDPNVYTQQGIQKINPNGSLAYTNKNAGFYYKPLGIKDSCYSKMASCDVSEKTTDKVLAASGTCGAWVMSDNLQTGKQFGSYCGALLSNPYGYVNSGLYPNNRNQIPNTNLTVTNKGVIIGYSGKLNIFKDMITEYGILLELLTEYYKECDLNALENTSRVLKKKASN